MTPMSSLELDRIRERRYARRAATRRDADPGAPAMVGRVVSAGSNLAVGKFLLVKPVSVLGAECEGCAPTLTVGAASVPVLLLGPRVPATGDDLVCRFVDRRWVAEKGGGSTPPTKVVIGSNCPCPVPTTLSMVSRFPQCNGGLFQSATLTYGPLPPEMASIGLTGNGFTSNTLTDQVSGKAFYYYISCNFNQYGLTQIIPDGNGGASRNGVLYFWAVGGNTRFGPSTCDPFSLPEGTAYPGADASCTSVGLYAG